MSYLFAVDRFIGRVITLDYLDPIEFNDALERRLVSTSYQWAMRLNAEDEDDPFAIRAKKLHDLSYGHLPLAFFILLLSTKVEGLQLELDSFNRLDATTLKDCDINEQFSLAEIYVHGVLSEDEHRSIFRLDLEQSLLRLERLRRMGLLLITHCGEVDSSNLYRLAPLMSHLTVAHLLNNNRLY